jgi:hypothetical protein
VPEVWYSLDQFRIEVHLFENILVRHYRGTVGIWLFLLGGWDVVVGILDDKYPGFLEEFFVVEIFQVNHLVLQLDVLLVDVTLDKDQFLVSSC